IAIPVIFFTVVLAVNKMNISQLGKLGGKLILYYTITTVLADLIGVSHDLFFNPGKNLTLPNTSVDKPELPYVSDILFRIVPENLFAAFSTGELMAILFIAIIIGMAMSTMIFSTVEKTRKYGDI